MKVTFKQFNQVMNLPEGEITEAQLDEIFGIFKNDDKLAKAKKEREELVKKLGAKQYALRVKEKNAAMAKANVAANRKPMSKDPRSAAGGKAAEMDWVKSMQSES